MKIIYKYILLFACLGIAISSCTNDFEEINTFLIKPKDYVKGTKMAYAGLKNEKDRASIILYLNEQSDSPLPLP